jgi:ABC-type branched-subunit amino acid transport system substrate-binding protein
MAVHPQAVIIAGPYAPAAAIVKQAHADGWRPQFLTVSFVSTEEFIKEDAEGTIITQVMPRMTGSNMPRSRSTESV